MNFLKRILTDHRIEHETGRAHESRGFNLGDLIVYALTLALFGFTGWQSWQFLKNNTNDSFALVPIFGLVGLDVGFFAWSHVWMHFAKSDHQDAISVGAAVMDFLGVVLTVLIQNVGSSFPSDAKIIATWGVYLVILVNAAAGVLYLAFSHETELKRTARKARAALDRDLQEATNLLERERLDAEYAQRILEQREHYIGLQEQMVPRKKSLDERSAAVRRELDATSKNKGVEPTIGMTGKLVGVAAKSGENGNEPHPNS